MGSAIQYMWLLLLFFLFINRRELLPFQFIDYLLFANALTIFSFTVDGIMKTMQHQPFFQLKELIITFVSIGISIFWIFYFKRSNRVRETFVFTYPEWSWKKALIEQHKTEDNKNN